MKPARVCLIDDPVPYANRHAVRRDGKQAKSGVGVADRYSAGVMTEAELTALGPAIRSILAPDAVVFAWATGPNLGMHFRIMEGRRFEYSTLAQGWKKIYPKSGATFRGTGRHVPSNLELLLQWHLPDPPPLWYPATGWKPDQVVEVPHPRYPTDIDDPLWLTVAPRVERGDGRHHEPSCRACRACLAGKIIHSRKPVEIHERIERWLSPHIGDFTMVELFATVARPGWVCLGWDVTGRDLRDDLRLMREEIEEERPARQLSLLEASL